MHSTPNFVSRVSKCYQTVRSSKAIEKINAFLLSPWGLAALAACTLCGFSFGLELAFYTLAILLVVYTSLFCDDFSPIMPLFVFCYVTAGPTNNPGKTESSFFYTGGTYILVLAGIAVVAVVARMALDKSIGFKKLFTKKRALLSGMLVLSLAYFLSGIGRNGYGEVVWKNLRFAFLQFICIVLLYFLFSATVKWNEKSGTYFAWLGVMMGVLVTLEVLVVYLQLDVVVDGVIIRDRIDAGWGCYNNIGAMITMSIPFAFYLSYKSKRPYWFILLGTGLLIGVVLSCSRGSTLGGILVYLVAFVYGFFYADEKRLYRISTYALLGVGAIVALFSWKSIADLFGSVPDIIAGTSSTEGIEFNDSGRISIYKEGLKVFLKYPIFGESFYPENYAPWEYSELAQLSAIIPPRWHNTIVQLLASCGAVGLLAYGFHRYQTIRLICKNPTRLNICIAASILGLVAMSMLDCHFFNLGPVLFYSMALAVAENAEDKIPLKKIRVR